MPKDTAISVKNVFKTFRIPHEKISSLRGAFVGMFKHKTYEEFQALNNVSFEVKKGEFFGIIGRNGSGKSTLLKVLAGIYQPDSGSVEVNGMISPFLELGIGFNPELSGRDNIYLNATVLGLTRKQIDKKFDSIVAFSELERFIDQKLKNYSSGMQVRLAFAVSIHANRDILLMDEVLAVGDSNFQSKCLEEFNRYKKMGKTVIIVTHDISVVERYCDRAMLLKNGKVIAIDKADEVANKYIHQNIDDEGNRLAKKEDVSVEVSVVEEKKRKKVAEITKVEFLDKDGKVKNVFQTGEDISVRVYFRVNKKIDELNFGITMKSERNEYVLGINTVFDKIDTKENIKKGFFQVDFNEIPLNSGLFTFLVNITKNNFMLPYDLLSKTQPLRIISRNKNEGIMSVKYAWK